MPEQPRRPENNDRDDPEGTSINPRRPKLLSFRKVAMMTLLIFSCLVQLNTLAIASHGPTVSPDPSGYLLIVDDGPKPAEPMPTGRLMFAIFFGPRPKKFRVGGEWTAQKPFYVDIPLLYFGVFRVMIVLPDEKLPEEKRQNPSRVNPIPST